MTITFVAAINMLLASGHTKTVAMKTFNRLGIVMSTVGT
jgi:hypothetical protein